MPVSSLCWLTYRKKYFGLSANLLPNVLPKSHIFLFLGIRNENQYIGRSKSCPQYFTLSFIFIPIPHLSLSWISKKGWLSKKQNISMNSLQKISQLLSAHFHTPFVLLIIYIMRFYNHGWHHGVNTAVKSPESCESILLPNIIPQKSLYVVLC